MSTRTYASTGFLNTLGFCSMAGSWHLMGGPLQQVLSVHFTTYSCSFFSAPTSHPVLVPFSPLSSPPSCHLNQPPCLVCTHCLWVRVGPTAAWGLPPPCKQETARPLTVISAAWSTGVCLNPPPPSLNAVSPLDRASIDCLANANRAPDSPFFPTSDSKTAAVWREKCQIQNVTLHFCDAPPLISACACNTQIKNL